MRQQTFSFHLMGKLSIQTNRTSCFRKEMAAQELSPVIIDNGSHAIKAGLAGVESPSEVFPSVVGKAPQVKFKSFSIGPNDTYVGDDAIQFRTKNNLKLTNPIEKGIVTNWDDVEKLWHYTIYRRLHIVPEEHPVLITETPLDVKESREKAISTIFEHFHCPVNELIWANVLTILSRLRIWLHLLF
jgi:actin